MLNFFLVGVASLIESGRVLGVDIMIMLMSLYKLSLGYYDMASGTILSQKLVIHNTYCSTCYKIILNFILFHRLYHVFDCVDVNFVLLDSADGLLHDGDREVGVEPEEGEGRAQHPHVLGVRTHCVHLDISN